MPHKFSAFVTTDAASVSVHAYILETEVIGLQTHYRTEAATAFLRQMAKLDVASMTTKVISVT